MQRQKRNDVQKKPEKNKFSKNLNYKYSITIFKIKHKKACQNILLH